jgi:hypothetical protein
MKKSTIRLVVFALVAAVLEIGCADDTASGRLLDAAIAGAKRGAPSVEHVASRTGYSVIVFSSPIDETVLRSVGANDREIRGILSTKPDAFKAAVAIFEFDGYSISWHFGEFFSVREPMRVERRGGESVRLRIDPGGARPTLTKLE